MSGIKRITSWEVSPTQEGGDAVPILEPAVQADVYEVK
jgi:hypothetical protein